MKVQLLLLLALAGPLSSFTRASPTTHPTDFRVEGTTPLGTTVLDTSFTGPPPTNPQALPKVVSTDGAVDGSKAPTDISTPRPDPITDTTVVVTESPAVHTSASAGITILPAETTAAPTLEITAPEETDGPLPESTKAPTDSRLPEDRTEGTDNGNTDEKFESEEGLSTAQIVGIVIGAIVAVVIVIAVVIAVLRRMGKYSSAKSRKPAKKDSVVSPLRKKSTKHQERAKFWKS